MAMAASFTLRMALPALAALALLGALLLADRAPAAGQGLPQYTLTLNATPGAGGSVASTPSGTTHLGGTSVSVTATAASGYRFAGWLGACSTQSGTCSLTMDGDREAEALFVTSSSFALVTTATPSAGGTVAVSPTATPTQTAAVTARHRSNLRSYASGNVTVTATANSGYSFAGWTGACSGTGTCTVAMTAHRFVGAHFARSSLPAASTTALVTVRVIPLEGATPAEIAGSPLGQSNFTGVETVRATVGSTVQVRARPFHTYHFVRFVHLGGGSCTREVSNNRQSYCDITVAAGGHEVALLFVPSYNLITSASPSAGGTVTGAGEHAPGKELRIQATANAGYRFARWSGACTGTARPCRLTMDADDREVTAEFEPLLTLTATPAAGGRIEVRARGEDVNFVRQPGNHPFPLSTVLDIEAKVNPGYSFSAWSGACTGTDAAVCAVTMSQGRALTATFTKTHHTLTTIASPPGSGTLGGGGLIAVADPATSASVTVTPAANHRFVGWSGACTGSSTCSVTMDADKTVTATLIRQYTLTTAVSPSGGGTLNHGGGTQDAGEEIPLVATPAVGYRFSEWSSGIGACPDAYDPSCTFEINQDITITAHFLPVPTYTLTVTARPAGAGTITGGGTYNAGSAVEVTQTPNSGYVFAGWLGACSRTGTCEVAMTGNREVVAFYGAQYDVRADISPSGGGTVSIAGRSPTPGSVTYPFNEGAEVTITATPSSGYRFVNWSGDCTGTGPCVVTADAARSVTANFVVVYDLTTSASPAAGGTVTGAGTYDTGTAVTVTARPNIGYRFGSWGGACTGTGACTVTMSAARTVAANFIRTWGLVATPAPRGGGTVTGSGTFDEGASATVTASANTGYTFAGWGGACTGTGACTVTMTEHRFVVAHFSASSGTFNLYVRAQPANAGTVTPAMDGTHTAGTSVTISATANAGYEFAGWTGGCATASCSITMNGHRVFVARFNRMGLILTTGVSSSGGGSVSGGGAYTEGTEVTVTARASAGYRFDRWTGAPAGCTGATCTFTMQSDRTVRAHFIRTYRLTASVSPSGGGTVTGGGTYDSGARVSVTARANGGYRFERWSGACTGTGACTVTMSGARTVTAHFVASSPGTGGNGGGSVRPGGGGQPGGGGGGGGSVVLEPAPEPVSGANVIVMSRVRGDAPRGASFRFRFSCVEAGGFALAPGGTRSFAIAADAACTLRVTDAEGAARVSGRVNAFPYTTAPLCLFTRDDDNGDLFMGRTFAAGDYFAEVVFDYARPERMGIPLARGITFIAWPGADGRSIEEALGSFASAVHYWDAERQRWLSWFPGGEAFGINTLASFAQGGVYAIARHTPFNGWRVEADEDWRAPSLIRLVRGVTFLSWPGDAVPVGQALGERADAVAAVYSWDTERQRWLSWFPGGGDLGINTLTAFQPGGIYVVSAREALDWRVPDGAAIVGEGEAGPPAC